MCYRHSADHCAKRGSHGAINIEGGMPEESAMVLTEKGLTLYPHETVEENNEEEGDGGRKKEKENAWMAISWGQLKDFYAGKVCGRSMHVDVTAD